MTKCLLQILHLNKKNILVTWFSYFITNMTDNSTESKGCLLFAGVIFVITAIATSIGLVFKGEKYLYEYTDFESDSTNIEYLRTSFFVLVVALVYFLYTRFKRNKTP